MVEFVKSLEERISDEKARAPTKVEADEHVCLQRMVGTFDDAFYTIEYNLTENGLRLDKEAEEAFAVLKHKLSDLKERT